MESEIQQALQALKKGGTILYPTDTVWGIGCNARSKAAVNKVFKIKKRAEYKSMVVLVADIDMLKRYVKNIPEVAFNLIKETKDPLTIIYPNGRLLADNVVAADGSVGIRIPNDDFCKELIKQFGKPIVSTSANISGEESPPSFKNIKLDILNSVDYIVNYKQQAITNTKPSTIVKVSLDGDVKVIRK